MELPDFKPGPPFLLKSESGKQIVGAIRKLDARDGYDTSKPLEYEVVEIFGGVVTSIHYPSTVKPSDDPPIPTPAMYWVRRTFIGSGNTDDPVVTYAATDDSLQLYPTTNLEEIDKATNILPLGQNVMMFAVLDRSQPVRKRYVCIGVPKWVWAQVGQPIPSSSGGSFTGGGGFYSGRLLHGSPLKIDPSTDLVIPYNPSESGPYLNPSGDAPYNVLLENTAESNLGDPPSHWVPTYAATATNRQGFTGPIVPCQYIGVSEETTPRPAYRFFYPRPGMVAIKISSGFSGAGAGRYEGVIVSGSAVAATGPLVLPDPGSDTTNTGPASATLNCVWCNLEEAGPNAGSGGFTLQSRVTRMTNAFVCGFYFGTVLRSGLLLPCYYGVASPGFTLFPVALNVNTGSGGAGATPITFTYDLLANFHYTLAPPYYYATNQTPAFRSFSVGPATAAAWGLASIDVDGTIKLWYAFEDRTGVTGTFSFLDDLGASRNIVFSNGHALSYT